MEATYSIFTSDDGEVWGGGGSYMVDEFTNTIKEGLDEILKKDPDQFIIITITSHKLLFDEVDLSNESVTEIEKKC